MGSNRKMMIDSWLIKSRCGKWKKMPRKSVKCLQNRKKSLPLQPHLRTSQTATRMQGSEKVLKKSSQKIWWFEKLVLPLHPLSPKNESRVLKKKFWKSSKKIWWLQKRVLPLHHFPPHKKAVRTEGSKDRSKQTETVHIAIYERRSLK